MLLSIVKYNLSLITLWLTIKLVKAVRSNVAGSIVGLVLFSSSRMISRCRLSLGLIRLWPSTKSVVKWYAFGLRSTAL